MPPGPDILPMGMQWRGQTKVELGICHLTWLLCSVYCNLEKKSETVATPEALFQNTFHSLSNYGVRLDELNGVLLKNHDSVAPRGLTA